MVRQQCGVLRFYLTSHAEKRAKDLHTTHHRALRALTKATATAADLRSSLRAFFTRRSPLGLLSRDRHRQIRHWSTTLRAGLVAQPEFIPKAVVQRKSDGRGYNREDWERRTFLVFKGG